MNSIKKRFLAVLLATLFCLLGSACSGNQENTTKQETGEEIPTTTGEEAPTWDPEEWTKLMGKTESWAGWAKEGDVLPGKVKTVSIQKPEDLAPYRSRLEGFTDQDANRILADKDGACVLVEIAASDPHTYYGTISITRNNNFIDIVINQETREEETLSHSFYLYYFPSNVYQGEHINVSFVGDIG